MGEIVWLGRYPVKSMLGEDLVAADLDGSGIAGDRRYALIDRETGLIASAKNPRKWRSLLTMAATAADGRVAITLPDGEVVEAGDPGADEVLSRAVGRPVRLSSSRPDGAQIERIGSEVDAAPGVLSQGRLAAGASVDTFVDYGDVHVITTATLDALAGPHPLGTMPARRFRPNIIIRMLGGRPFAENSWPARIMTIGSAARLRMVVPTPRCVVPTLAQGTDLPADPQVLRTAARMNRTAVLDLGVMTCVGVYGSVVDPGRLRVGDTVLFQ